MRPYQMPFYAPLLVALAGPALAVDGVIEINQTAALAGAVTATDSPEFPVTLDAPGKCSPDLCIYSASTGNTSNGDNYLPAAPCS